MSDPFTDLGDAISDQRFVDVDLALRRGQHIDHDDADWYAYLLDAQAILEPFYRRYGCELIHRSDGYFFLLPTGDKVAKRLLGVPEMIVGQCAALLYLDPSTIESGGVVTKEDILSHLAAVMGTDALIGVFNPKRKRMDERVAQETVRQRVAEGLRKLNQLGFLSLTDDNRVHLRSALMRFADPVRGAGSPRDALEKLIARGEVSIPAEPQDDDEKADQPTPPGQDDEGTHPNAAHEEDAEPNDATLVALDSDDGSDSTLPTAPSDDDFDDDFTPDDATSVDHGDAVHSNLDFVSWSEDSPDRESDSDPDFEEPMEITFDEPSVPRTPSPEDASHGTEPPSPEDEAPEDEAPEPRRKRRKQQSVDSEADFTSSEPTNTPKFDEFD